MPLANTGNPSSDVEKARKNARTALASEIETTIQSDTSLRSRDNSKGDVQDSLTMLINEEVNLRLDGVELVDSYHTPKMGYWFYYRLPREALDPRPLIAQGVHELATQLHPPVKISFGSITYADTGLGSAFSLYLEDQILLALRSEKGITVAAQTPRVPIPGEGARKESGTPSTTSPANDAARDTVVLTANFFGESAGKIPVFLRLVDQSRSEIVASSSFALDRASLPSSLATLPSNYSSALATKNEIANLRASKESDSTSFQVRLWTERGQGSTYLDGEELVVNFSSTRDCYIKVYHVDVNGRVSLILPNRYSRDNFFKSGKVYQVPSPGAPYRFLLGKPYGVEFVKVVASTAPFDGIEESFSDLGQASRGLLGRGLSVAATGNAQSAEALVSYTILGRDE